LKSYGDPVISIEVIIGVEYLDFIWRRAATVADHFQRGSI